MRSLRFRLRVALVALVALAGVIAFDQPHARPPTQTIRAYSSMQGFSPDPSGTPEMRRIVDDQRWYQWAASVDLWNATARWNEAIAKQKSDAEAAARAAARKAAPATTPHATTSSAGHGGSVSVGAFLACIKGPESGGNYSNADTGHNGHYGAYQFAPRTWNDTASRHADDLLPTVNADGSARYGRDLIGVRPDHAAPADQDQMAVWLLHDAGRGQWSTAGSCS